MNWIKNILAKLVGKSVDGEIGGVSKAKLTAVVYVLILGIQEISKAWGSPIVIPDVVFRFLEGAGLWAVRDAIK